MKLFRPWLVIALPLGAVAGFVIFLALTFVSSNRDHERLQHSTASAGWSTGQAGIEFHRFVAAFDRYRLGDPGTTADDVQLRFEILYSRIPVLLADHDFIERLGLAGLGEELQDMLAQLDLLAPQIERLSMLDDESLATLRGRIDALWPILQDVLQRIIAVSDSDIADDSADRSTEFWFSLGGLVLSSAAVLALLGYKWRQSARRLAELDTTRDALAATEGQFRKLVAEANNGVLILDQTDQPLYANNALTRILGCSVSARDVMAAKVLVPLVAKAMLRPRGPGVARFRYERPDGKIVSLQATESVTEWHGRSARLMVVSDVTDLQAAEMQNVHLSRLIALGEMTAALAHELLQPLSVASMAAQNALEQLEVPDPEHGYLVAKLERIVAQIRRAREVMSHMRRFGQQGGEEPREFDLASAIEGAFGLIGAELQKAGILIKVQVPSEHAMVRGFPIQLEQVLINLVMNARDAISQRLREYGGGPAGRISVKVTAGDGDRWLVDVVDNGIGIAPDLAPYIFESFVTSKVGQGGTGLGLSIASSIVQAMGGTLSIGPAGDAATCMRVELPKAPDSGTAETLQKATMQS